MKGTLALLMITVLAIGGEALQCHVCKEVKEDDKVNEDKSVACDAASIKTCGDGDDACVTSFMGFTFGTSFMSTKTEQTSFVCGAKVLEGAEDTICKGFETGFNLLPGFKDFTCSSEYCQTDLCNAGYATQVSLLILGVTIALFGLLF